MLYFLPITLVALIACSGDDHSVSGQRPPVGSIAVLPTAAAAFTGGGLVFTATVRDQANNPINGRVPSWSSSDGSVATVDNAGVATAVSVGTATITASAGGVSGSATISVKDPRAPQSLVVQAQPVGGLSGVTLSTQPEVKILDGTGAVASASTLAVTATIIAGTGTLIGTMTVGAVAGVATFRNLQVTGSGNFVLTFSTTSPSMQVASATFAVEPVTVTVAFQDDFESGDFSHTQNGVSWSSVVYLDVTTNVSHSGTHAARFREGESVQPGGGNWSELRFDGLANLPEVFMQYYLYLPSGSESPSVGPKAKILGTLNDKFFRLWGGGDVGYTFGAGNTTNPFSNKVGASTWGVGSGAGAGLDGSLGIEYSYSAAGTQWGMGQGPGRTATPVPFINDANRGRWVQIRVRAKNATAANNDGVVQIWVDGTLVQDDHALINGDIYGGTGPTGYTTGYLLGWANNGWPAGQYVYLDDFVITTGSFGPP
jgi:hypothetical protein